MTKTCDCGAAVFGDFCYKCMKPIKTEGIEVTHDDRRKVARRADDDETDFYSAYGKLQLHVNPYSATIQCSVCGTVFVDLKTAGVGAVGQTLPLSALAHTCSTKVRP